MMQLNDVIGTFMNEFVNSYATIKYCAFFNANIKFIYSDFCLKMVCKK